MGVGLRPRAKPCYLRLRPFFEDWELEWLDHDLVASVPKLLLHVADGSIIPGTARNAGPAVGVCNLLQFLLMGADRRLRHGVTQRGAVSLCDEWRCYQHGQHGTDQEEPGGWSHRYLII